jgi:hypothetical protein
MSKPTIADLRQRSFEQLVSDHYEYRDDPELRAAVVDIIYERLCSESLEPIPAGMEKVVETAQLPDTEENLQKFKEAFCDWSES